LHQDGVNSERYRRSAEPGVEAMPKLTLRIDFDEARAIGPGKIKLLELIDALGSISAAGRQMGMSYRRAWLLADALNRCFREPVITSQAGGANGGGAALTPLGCAVVHHYRAVEAAAHAAGAPHIEALDAALAERQPGAAASAADKPHRLALGIS
jgi:molybdate transport system regulatory protein